MDYTQSNSFVTDAGTTQRMHVQAQAVPTAVSDADMNMVIWEAMEIVKAAGLAGAPFDKAVPATYRLLLDAIKRLAGGNVTTVTFANSPFTLTAANAGLVLVDATAGNVVLNLPLANVLLALQYSFRRVDVAATTVTVNRAGADTIDEGGLLVTLSSKAGQQIRSSGASTWSTVSAVPATQSETSAGVNDSKFVTALKLRFGFSISLTANGHIKFPAWLGGLIVQWCSGVNTAASGSQVVTLPIAFPSGVLAAVVSNNYATAAQGGGYAVLTTSLSSVTVGRNNVDNINGVTPTIWSIGF